MKKKYKIWMHLEEITEDENGNDIDFKTMDEHILPEQIGNVYNTLEQAKAVMNEYSKF